MDLDVPLVTPCIIKDDTDSLVSVVSLPMDHLKFDKIFSLDCLLSNFDFSLNKMAA